MAAKVSPIAASHVRQGNVDEQQRERRLEARSKGHDERRDRSPHFTGRLRLPASMCKFAEGLGDCATLLKILAEYQATLLSKKLIDLQTAFHAKRSLST